MSNAPATPTGGKPDKNAPPDQSMIGPYKLVNFIAGGKSSQVWEAMAADGQRHVAVKVLTGDALKDSEQIAAMRNEFTVGKALEHPNIIKYFDGHWGSLFKKDAFFSMELFLAPNLKSQMFNNLNSVQVRFKRIVESAAMAYQHLHEKGYVHKDIKPDNVLVNRSAEVKIIDMSLAGRPASALAKVFAAKSRTAKGTRSYMAPEQIMRKPLSFQVDMYAFGVTLFEMLTGQPPFTGTTPNDLLMRHIQDSPPPPSFVNPNVTAEMDRIILRLLSKKPDQRHKSFNEFLAEFRKVSPFKEEVLETKVMTDNEKAQQDVSANLGERLDSRTDALRTMLGVAAPARVQKEKQAADAKAAAAAKPAPAAPAPPKPAPAPPAPAQQFPGQPMPGQFPPGQFPPGQYMPGQMMPGQFFPGQMMPGQMQPGQMPGQAPYPMQPQFPPQPVPGGPTPWVAAPAAPAAGAPAARPVAPAVPVNPGVRPAVPAPTAGVPVPPVVPKPSPAVPAAARPAAPPQPAKPAAGKPASQPTPAAPGGMRIDDLAGFDDLPSA